MSRPFFYCSELSRLAAEKSYGTASTGEVWVLVEYPYAWGPKALEDSALSFAVKRHLSRLNRSIQRVRLLFIKRERPAVGSFKLAALDTFKLFVVRARERDPFIVEFKLESYEQLLSLNIGAAAAGEATAGIIRRDPLFLVCTHGRRDKCCAKFGYALYKNLRAGTGARVWQSSHVGGDRFAANLVCFPHGLFYGHVGEDAGRRIVDEFAEGRLVLDGYRGRTCYGHAVQSAEFFIRRESGLRGLDELRYLRRERLSENSWRVQFAAHDGQRIHVAQVTGRPSPFQNYITCHATEEQSVVQFELDAYES
jgi:hypothetical protein